MKKLSFLIAILSIAGVVNTRAQNVNNALSFDGSDDYIAIPEEALNNLPSGTIACWVYLNTNDEEAICARQWDGYNSYTIFTIGCYSNTNGTNTAGIPGKLYFHGHNGVIAASSKSNLSTGQWYHVAVTFSSSQCKLYINGGLDNVVNGHYAIDNQSGVTATSVGAWLGDGGGRYLNGKIDEFRVWDRARTQTEIQFDMIGAVCGNLSGLAVYYPFNQGIASGNNIGQITLDDLTTNNYNGTLYNFALTGGSSNWVTGTTGLSDSATFYQDADGDGYGNPDAIVLASACNPPSGYVPGSTDCNDANAAIHPSAAEVCNGIDDNCNGSVDEITGLNTTNITATTATLNWKKLPGSKVYAIKYRRLEQSPKPWTVTGAGASSIGVIISGLQANTRYVWLIKSHCDGFNTAFSGPVKFKTAAALSAAEQREESIKAAGTRLSVYPNPGNGNMTVHLPLSKPQAVLISVSDVTGKEVYVSNEGIVSSTFTKKFDLSKLRPGIYFLKLTHDGKSEIKKILVKK